MSYLIKTNYQLQTCSTIAQLSICQDSDARYTSPRTEALKSELLLKILVLSLSHYNLEYLLYKT